MRSVVNRWHTLALTLFAMCVLVCIPSELRAQGGEPREFAIRGARVVPVSGPPIDDATILISRA